MLVVIMRDGKVIIENENESPIVKKIKKIEGRRIAHHNNGEPITVKQNQSRNSKCNCGSGKKYKVCCAIKTD